MTGGRRALRAAVLVVWAGFFGWLWITGSMTRFLGPRTYWVVAFGTIACSAAGLVHVASLGKRSRESLRRVDVLGAAVLIAPVLALIAVPDARLGALAASRRSLSGAAVPAFGSSGPVGFAEIQYAGQSEEYAANVGVYEGRKVTLTGFVAEGGIGSFKLARFYVSCCAADAIPYSVRIETPDPFHADRDEWLRVQGSVTKDSTGYVLQAHHIRSVAEPADPYLN
jgi:uncharacterized repeat protein (TIGR03943 family)